MNARAHAKEFVGDDSGGGVKGAEESGCSVQFSPLTDWVGSGTSGRDPRSVFSAGDPVEQPFLQNGLGEKNYTNVVPWKGKASLN